MHQFEDGKNTVNMRVFWKKENPQKKILISIMLACLTIMIFRLIPESVSGAVMSTLVNPLIDTYMGALMTIVGPLMFLTVTNGIISIGTPAQLGVVGRIIILLFYKVNLGLTIGGSASLKSLLQMFFDIVPDNIVTPFMKGNTMQIIFMAVVTGSVMLVLRARIKVVTKVVAQLDLVANHMLTGIIWLLPAFVYLSIVRMGLSGDIGELPKFIKMILLLLAGSLLIAGTEVINVKARTGIPARSIIRALWPSYLIAFATSSSSAAYSECAENCIKKFGVKETLVNFGLPVGLVVYAPDDVIWMMLLGVTCMEYQNLQVTPVEIIVLVILAALLAIAVPPIPGGMLSCYTLLFSQMGIPASMLAFATVLNIVVDTFGCGGHVFANQLQIINIAADLDMMDKSVPEKKLAVKKQK